jgi:hypothetical protein
MSDDVIEFYKQVNAAKDADVASLSHTVETVESTAANNDVSDDDQHEDVSHASITVSDDDDPFNKFLRTLNSNLIKTQQSVRHNEEATPTEDVDETVSEEADPFESFINKFQDIVLSKKEQEIKKTTLEFIKELKEDKPPIVEIQPEEIEDIALPEPVIEQVPDVKPEEAPPVVETVPVVNDPAYVGELKSLSKIKKKPVVKDENPNDIKNLITKQVESQTSKILEDVKAYAKRILDLGGGGGSVAQQFANGGTMNGDLNVTGQYLSAGVNLASIFSGGGGAADRLTAGSQSLILNPDGTLSFPVINNLNTISSPDDTEIVIESQNAALSAYTQIALTPHGFIAYDSGGESITFDSISNTIAFKTADNYTWTLDDQGNILGPNGVLTVSGNINATNKILSGGRDLADIFLTSETDSQTLTFNVSTLELSISNGNSVSLSALSSTGISPDQLLVNSAVASNSANWSKAYDNSTVYAINSASYATNDYVIDNYFPLSGGYVAGETHFNGNVTVFGNLTATGTTTFANTVFSVTSALSVVHIGSGPALWVGNDGSGDIASFYDIDQGIEILHVGGNNGTFPNVGVKTSAPNKTLTVAGEISATSDITTSGKIYIQGDGNSDQWNSAFNTATTYQNTSATFLAVSVADTTYAKLSSNAFTYDPSVSSIDTINVNNIASGIFSGVLGGNRNTASGRYSTVVGGFSSCATGFSTFVGTGSGSCATGDYAIIVGGLRNTASGCYNTVGGGRLNSASGPGGVAGTDNTIAGGCANRVFAKCQTIGGGAQNCIGPGGAQSTISGGYQNNISSAQSTIVGGIRNNISGTGSFTGGSNNTISGNFSNIGGGCCNTVSGNSSNINGGLCQTVNGVFSTINGGLGNFNPLRDSIIGGGVANHTGGFAPFNITTAASISGNGTQTRLTGTGIQSLFSFPFTSGNVSLYYSTPTVPLSSGTFTTATIAATGTNFIVVNGDYSTCTPTGLSATSIFVYDRAINNTGYGSVVVGGKLNTASGCYSTVGGGFRNTVGPSINNVPASFTTIGGGCNNTASAYFATIAGGQNNFAQCRSSVVGGAGNSASSYGSFVGGGQNNNASGRNSAVGGGTGNCPTGACSFVGAGGVNVAGGNFSAIVGGRCNTTSSAYSSIVGGKFNYNPLFNSNIEGGSFNHTGGFAPANITSVANISGNGTQTALIQSGIGSCFSASNTTGAVSLMWMTSGTANQSLSSACFTTANVVTNAANCIIINGDYSTRTATGLSACDIWVYDRCLNNTGCTNFIGGGVLNTASGCYSFVGGGLGNIASNLISSVVGGCLNAASGRTAVVGGGRFNSASGQYSAIYGGSSNTASSLYSIIVGGSTNRTAHTYAFIGGGQANCVCTTIGNGFNSIVGGRFNCSTGSGTYSFIGGGCCNVLTGIYSTLVGGTNNIASGAYSFVAGGSANNTSGFANTFILGTALSASAANFTYVNNLSSRGVVVANPLRVGNSLTATGPVGSITG